ncbi:MAG: glycosyltransferase [bacterium]
MNNNPVLSIILLSYYSGKRINDNYEKLYEIFDKNKIPFEFIVIDDGSKDDSFKIALALERRNNNVRAYQLSRNFTSHYSVFAGLSVAEGGCAIAIPDDFQIPFDTIVNMYRFWENGEKLIIPRRESRDDGFIRDFFSNLYYYIMNSLSIVDFPRGGADLFFADREIIDILNNRIHPINTSSIVEVLRLGFDPYFLPFKRPVSADRVSRWTLKKKIKLAKDTFISSSTFPIKMINAMGLLFFCFSLISIPVYIIMKLRGLNDLLGFAIPGWTSIILLLTLIGGLILLSLSIISEYIWRIYEEVKARPGYIIRKKEDKNEDLGNT